MATGLSEASGPDGGMLLKPETKAVANESASNSPQQLPPGAEFLKAFKAYLDAGKEMLGEAKVMQEANEVKSFVAKMIEAHDKALAMHEESCGKGYPDSDLGYGIKAKAEAAAKPEEKPEGDLDALPEKKAGEAKEKPEGEIKSEEPEGKADKDFDLEHADTETKSEDEESTEAKAETDEEDKMLKSFSDRLYALTGERI